VLEAVQAVYPEATDGAQLREQSDGSREQQALGGSVVGAVVSQSVQHTILKVVHALGFHQTMTIWEHSSKSMT